MTLAMRRLVGVVLTLLLTGLGWARSSAEPAGKPQARAKAKTATPKPSQPTESAVVEPAARAGPVSRTVRGRVVLPDGTSIGGLVVRIGAQRVLVDRDGWFEFADVPESYDLSISELGGRFITAYFGLTRRDPMVTHTARGESHQAKQDHHADIEGAIDAAPTATAEQVARPAVCFLSPLTAANGSLVGYQQNHGQYRVCVGWNGLPLTSGVLVALARADGKAYLAKRSLTIVDGERIHPNRGDDKIRTDLRLEPVATGQIEGSAQTFTRKIQIMNSEEEQREILKVAYAVPGTAGLINLGDCQSKEGTFVCQVPDLSALGGEYCLAIVPSAELKMKDHVPGPRRQVDIHANRCGGKFGMKDFQIHRAPSPDIGEGAFSLTRHTLAWTVADDTAEPLYQLNIGSCAEESCLVAYLNRSTFSWADFETTGMTYLRGSSLLVSVSAFYPPTSMDELAAGVWRFSDRTTWQRTDSRVIPIFLADPPKHARSVRTPKGLDVQDLAKLPTCSAMIRAHSIGDLDAAMDDKRISVRGILGFTLGPALSWTRDMPMGPNAHAAAVRRSWHWMIPGSLNTTCACFNRGLQCPPTSTSALPFRDRSRSSPAELWSRGRPIRIGRSMRSTTSFCVRFV